MGMRAATRRLVLECVGWALVVLGVAALLLPGPGLLLLFAGLAVLAEQYEWAARRVEPVRDQALRTATEGVRTLPRLLVSLAGVVALVVVGITWGIRPDVPGWWPFDQRWWLVGGWTTGSTILFSAAVALSLLGYSWRKLR